MFKQNYMRILIASLIASTVLVIVAKADDNTNCPSNDRQEFSVKKRTNSWSNLTPEQKFLKMREWRIKMEQGLTDLRKKQQNGSITDEEKQRLERMEKMLKRLDQRLTAVTNVVRSSENQSSPTNNTPKESYEKQDK